MMDVEKNYEEAISYTKQCTTCRKTIVFYPLGERIIEVVCSGCGKKELINTEVLHK